MTVLFPQVVWDAQDLMFSMPEPGVYMLQMGGSISGANVVAKMVNDDVEAEVVTLEGTKDTVFRCRSTIFTVEDDDHEAERLLVEVSFVNIIILFTHTPEWAFNFWHQFAATNSLLSHKPARRNILISLVFNAFAVKILCPVKWGVGSDFHFMKKT